MSDISGQEVEDGYIVTQYDANGSPIVIKVPDNVTNIHSQDFLNNVVTWLKESFTATDWIKSGVANFFQVHLAAVYLAISKKDDLTFSNSLLVAGIVTVGTNIAFGIKTSSDWINDSLATVMSSSSKWLGTALGQLSVTFSSKLVMQYADKLQSYFLSDTSSSLVNLLKNNDFNNVLLNGVDSSALVTINDTPQGTARITRVWADGVEYSLEDPDGSVNIPDKVKNLTTSDYKITENNSYDPTKPDAQNQQAVTEQVNNNIIYSQGGVTVTVNDPNKLSSSLLKDALAMAITTDYDRVGNGNIVDTYVLSDWANKELSITTPIVMQAVALNTSENALRTYVDPLVLDLNGDGVKLTDYDFSPVLFDSDNDGSQEVTGWTSGDDGIVVVDRNGNGKIDDISETLSEYYGGTAGTDGSSGTKPYANGFAALKSLDSNNDGIFNASDTSWSSVKVWVDGNHDGKSWVDNDNDGVVDSGEASELYTLAQLGITKINLTSTSQSGLVLDGNEVLASGTFVQNGVTKEAIAANFLADANGSTFTVSGTGTVVTTQGTSNTTSNSAYVAGAGTAGATINVAEKGVKNAVGGAGNDTLIGDSQNNWLSGGQGSDTFNAGAGDDVLIIDAADLQANIHAGAGDDIIQVIGDEGVTLNLAEAEVEIAQGGRGNDTLIGGGVSTVYIAGGDGDDTIIGGVAGDVLSGEDGNDYIDGFFGDDILRGHRGNDLIYGEDGNDIIDGGQDDDTVYGGSGNDVLKGGAGDDYIDGGDGTDAVEYTGSYSEYRITRTDKGVFISDTVSGRDGTDFVENVEKVSFSDISLLDLPSGSNVGLKGPLPVEDVLTVDSSGNAFNHTTAHLISASQLLGNDIDWQGDTLHITGLYDVQGGTATLTQTGDVLFTPNPAYTGIMGFKYTVADSAGNYTNVIQIGTTNTAQMEAEVYLKTADLPSDPLLVDEWYLSETNVLSVWKNYTGKGVKIGQFEPGGDFSTTKEILDYTHYDLKDNIDPDWLAVATEGEQAGEGSESRYSNHATMVAGVMVASKNGEGTVGVAYDATVAGYWLPGNISGIEPQLKKMKWYDVVNNSWGFDTNFAVNTVLVGAQVTEYVDAVSKGRSGLGTVIVSSAGNDRDSGGNANSNYNSNNRLEITVGAINATTDLGVLEIGEKPFSSPGANILVSAPGSNIEATSRIIQADNGSIFGSDTSTVEGTSFAAPIVSGIVALMLEANPDLGYRDIQEILAMSAKKVTDSSTTWIINGSNNWNGGGMHFSSDYGFGEIDAQAAVSLAENWITQQTYYNEHSLATVLSSGTINKVISDGNTNGITSSISVTDNGIQIEHVEVRLNITHANAGDLVVKLIAPDGTTSVLMNRPGVSKTNASGDATFAGSNTLDYVFTSTADWGEKTAGTWSLQVIDANGNNLTGTLKSWSINFYGNGDTANDQYVYTNEYASLAGSGGRNVLNDTDGGKDTINVAAISSASTVNLTTGAATLAGTALTIQNPGNIENIVGGDYNDTLTGNAATNILVGGRGNDVLSGAAGNDVLFGDQGNDTLTGGADGDAFVIDKERGSADIITDFTINTDRIVLSGFSANAYTALTFTQVGADTQVNLGDGQTLLVKNVTASALTASNFVSVADGVTPLDVNGYAQSFGSDNPDNMSLANNAKNICWSGDGADTVYGGTGNDLIYGGNGNDTLFGGTGNDMLYGGAGMDYIDAGAGNDTIYLEGDQGLAFMSGQDIFTSIIAYGVDAPNAAVTGGSGNDRFVVVEDKSATASNGLLKNLILDFDYQNTNEKIDLSKISSVHSVADLHTTTVQLYNSNGVLLQQYLRIWLGQVASGTQYITLQGITAAQLSSANFIFADADASASETVSNSLISGTSGNDYLTGDAGGQTLDGGPGADTMEGRTGADTYIVNNAGDVVIELPDGGDDTIKSSVTYTLPAEVENLTLTGTANINGTGNSRANRIYGNSGNNVLNGGAGSDVLIGGAGNDTYIVDDGADQINENVGEGTDTVQSSVSFTLGDNIENLTLTGTNAINATGNALVNVLVGNAADNKLDGAQGADTMAGGRGDDVYLVDNAGDVVAENVAEGIDTVYSAINYTLGANVENLILANSVVSGTGNSLDNEITGNAANNILYGGVGSDWLDGGTGADTMIGGTGDDTFVVDNTGDVVTENADEGSDTVLSSITYTLGANVDNLALTGTTAINGTGNSLNNILIGNSGNNVLIGGAGNDILDGGYGNDNMIGGVGDDTYVVDNSGDVVTENAGEGTDTIKTGFTYTLRGNLENLTLTGVNNINGIGNSLNNIITGNSGDNVLDGGTGTDTLLGGAGNDTYIIDSSDAVIENANEGIDNVQAGFSYSLGNNVENLTLTGTDNINGTGNALDNTLIGNSGNNILDGGAGNDILEGGLGDDTYIYSSGYGYDIIYSYEGIGGNGNDTVRFGAGLTGSSLSFLQSGQNLVVKINDTWETLTFTNWFGGDNYQVDTFLFTDNSTLTAAQVTSMATSSGETVIIGTSGNDTLIGGTGAEHIYGLNGNDILNGGAGADIISGGAGNDTYIVDNVGGMVIENDNEGIDTVQSSVSYTLGANVENLILTGNVAINGVGNYLDNVIIGNSSNNVLYGWSGNDILNGGYGNDTMIGGTGNDTYVADNSSDIVLENADEGIDTVQTSSSYRLGDNVENLTLVGTDNIDGEGNSLDNVIIGNSGDNELYGGDPGTGMDTLFGGAGNDSLGEGMEMHGGSGDDLLYESCNSSYGCHFLYGEAGNDYFYSGAPCEDYYLEGDNGQDCYDWNGNGGGATIINNLHTDMIMGYRDCINFINNDGQIRSEPNIRWAQYGADLECNINGLGYMRIQNAFLGAIYQGLDLRFADHVISIENVIDEFANYVSIDFNDDGDFNYDRAGEYSIFKMAGEQDKTISNNSPYSGAVSIYDFNGADCNTVYGADYDYGAFYFSGNNGGQNIAYGGNYANDTFIFEDESSNTAYGGNCANDTFIFTAYGDNSDEAWVSVQNNTAYGGSGNNTFIWGLGASGNTICCGTGDGQDTLQFQNIALDSIAFERDGNDLICIDKETNHNITVMNYLSGSACQIDKFQFDDGTLTATQVNQMIGL